MENREIHNIYNESEVGFEYQRKLLDKLNTTTRNKELIKQFQLYLFCIGTGERRVTKLTWQMRILCEYIQNQMHQEKNLDELDRHDLINLVALINCSNYADATKADYRRCIKQFYRWYKDEDPRLQSDSRKEREDIKKFYLFLERQVKRSCKLAQADPTTIISDADVDTVIENEADIRNRAFAIALHESGCRASEFLNLRIGDLTFQSGIVQLHIPDCKTGQRMVFLNRSCKFLDAWLKVHPYRRDDTAYLWVGKSGSPIKYSTGRDILIRMFKQASVFKRCNYHWFRHSRATILAPHFTEPMLCKFMGWTLGSQQIARYCHLCVDQLRRVCVRYYEETAEAGSI